MNPEHAIDIDPEDCDECCGRGWKIYFCDEVIPERCEDCKGEGFTYPDEESQRDNYFEMKANMIRGHE